MANILIDVYLTGSTGAGLAGADWLGTLTFSDGWCRPGSASMNEHC